MSWLALDIGGANLKAADGIGWAASRPFALWRDPAGLAEALAQLIAAAPPADRIAITMTGELCDAFRSKADGVRHIVNAAVQAAGHRELAVYLTDGQLVPADIACELPHLAAAANWHALARFAGRYAIGAAALVVDVGSTTTDIIPLTDSKPSARGATDTERLLAGELVYTGVLRTPISAVTPTLPWRGNDCPVAAELFATTADAYLLLGDIGEDAHASWTADGRPLTAPFARERLARMICADATTFNDHDARQAAEFIRDAQLSRLRDALARVASHAAAPQSAVVSGAGEFLARRLLHAAMPDCRIVSLAEVLGPTASACAPAHALAVVAREERGE